MEDENKISVVINTYNAREHLREVLDALTGFDEIVVCDMESTDDTPDIAREYGCRLTTFKRGSNNIVEPARDYAIHQTRYPWVLVVDADEVVTPQLESTLRSIAANPPAGVGGWLIARQNRFMGSPELHASPDYQLRFFRGATTRWPSTIHSRPEVDGTVSRIPPAKGMFIHLDDKTIAELAEKINRYTDREAEKKMNRKYGASAVLIRPLWAFVRSYFLRGGMRNGLRGLINSELTAFYQFLVVAKVIEKRIRKS